MNSQKFWRAAAVQGALVGVLFVVLAVTVDRKFFEDNGIWVGPIIWIACSLISGRILGLPVGFTLFCALAGAVAGLVAGLAGAHEVGIAASVAVFAACVSGYDENADPAADPPRGDGQASKP
ncbi:MAG: hypothetical protein QOE06_3035 [Thermoleophilaceae bacterium]|nr:hypothetical protein [Thermoleophilaceae bacterium]